MDALISALSFTDVFPSVLQENTSAGRASAGTMWPHAFAAVRRYADKEGTTECIQGLNIVHHVLMALAIFSIWPTYSGTYTCVNVVEWYDG